MLLSLQELTLKESQSLLPRVDSQKYSQQSIFQNDTHNVNDYSHNTKTFPLKIGVECSQLTKRK